MRLLATMIACAGLALLSSSAPSYAAPHTPADRATLHGSAPRWASAANYLGAADASASVGFRVYLGWQNSSEAEALVEAVSNPGSASYGHYVSAAEFRRR